MQRKILGLAAITMWGAMQLAAQHPPHRSPLENLLRPVRHAAPASTESTPQMIFDATQLGSPLLLDKGWRVGITSNAAAANPDYDDSTWATRDAQEAIADVGDQDHPAGTPEGKGPDDHPAHPPGPDGNPGHPPGHERPFAWFRLHIKLAPDHGPVALYLGLPVSQNTSMSLGTIGPGVDVFANGEQISPEGPHGDAPQHFQQISRIYNLKLAANQTSLVLVVRTMYIPFGYGAYTSFFSNRSLRLGNREDLDRMLELWSAQSVFERLPRLVNSILLLVLAVFLLALYFSQQGHVEYLWLALHELLQAPIGFIDLAGSTAHIDQLWYGAITLQLILLSAYLYFEFVVSFLSLRAATFERAETAVSVKKEPRRWLSIARRWCILLLRYTAPILLGVGPSLLFVGRSRTADIILAVTVIGGLFWVIGWVVFIFTTLIVATLRRNFEAGLLLIPLVLSFVGILEPVLTASMNDLGGASYKSPLTILAGPIPIHFASIADFAGIFVIVLIIFVRFLRINRDQERVSSELAAARSVQELMIPQEKLQTPGFEVDSIYTPAQEVGGDFFHVETTTDGGLLVVIGDVAGKGLKAAMNVSMLMGALRRTPDRSPGKILESLNRVLVGSESFTTCQAAWFGANGELVLANAGHLPPYLNSQEIALPGGLPLGVLPEVSYEEVRLYLHPGDRMLLMSDGVVEARQNSGELFGFDRVHNLSNQSAFYIADAAKAFGQEDDITVLTVRKLAQAMAA